MDSEKGWYWVGVGILALGLTNMFAHQMFAHLDSDWSRLVERPVEMAQEVSCKVVDRLQSAVLRLQEHGAEADVHPEVMLARAQTRVARANTMVARRSADAARFNAAMCRQSAKLARLQTKDLLR